MCSLASLGAHSLATPWRTTFANVKVVEVEFLPAPVLRLPARWQPALLPAGAGSLLVGARLGFGSRLIRPKTWLRRWRLSSRLLPAFEFDDLWVAKAAPAPRSSQPIRPT